MALNEIPARRHFIAHEHAKYYIGLSSAFNGHLLQRACIGIHGGVPQLLRIHFTQTFVTLNEEKALNAIKAGIAKQGW